MRIHWLPPRDGDGILTLSCEWSSQSVRTPRQQQPCLVRMLLLCSMRFMLMGPAWLTVARV